MCEGIGESRSPHFIVGPWCNGNMPSSKLGDGGSIPSGSAMVRKADHIPARPNALGENIENCIRHFKSGARFRRRVAIAAVTRPNSRTPDDDRVSHAQMRIARRHIVMCGAVAASGFLPCVANAQVRSCIPECESRWLLHRADVAQVEERLFETQEVAGSKPAIGATGCHVLRPATVPCTYGAESSILSRSTLAAFSGVRHEEPA